MKRWWSQFLDSRVITWQAYLITAVITVGFAPHLVQSVDLEEAQLRRLAFFIAQVMVGLVLLFANFTYLRGKRVRDAKFLSMATVFMVSSIFVLSIRLIAQYALNLQDPLEVALRAVNGLIAIAMWQFFIAVVVSETDKFRTLVDELEIEIRKGQTLEVISVERLERLRARVAGEVTAALNDSFAKLAIRSKIQQKSKQLRELVDSVIKPLSQSLTNREPDEEQLLANKLDPKIIRRLSVGRVLYAVVSERPFDARVAPLAVVVLTHFSRIWAGEGVTPIWILLVTWANVTLLMSFGTLIQKALQARLSDRAWLVVAVLFTTLASAFDAAATQVVFGQFETIRFIGLFMSDLLVLSLSAVIRGVNLDRLRVIRELQAATDRVSWMNARLNQLIWVEKKRLSRMVHGDIQSRIIATALNIELSEKNEAETRASLDALRAKCEGALINPVQTVSLVSFIESLQTIWQDTVLVENKIDHQALEAIENDPVTIDTVSEFIREAITNAAKHGKASKVCIEATLLDEVQNSAWPAKKLQLDIRDNGKAESGTENFEPGQGSDIFSQISLSWHLTETEDGFLLSAVIPIKTN